MKSSSYALSLLIHVIKHWAGMKRLYRRSEAWLLLPSRNPIQLAEVIKTVLENIDLVNRMSRNGRRTAIEGFKWDLVAGRVEGAIDMTSHR